MGYQTAVDGDWRGGLAHAPRILFKADGSSPQSEKRTRDCYFHMTLASAGEALVFHFSSVAKQ